MIKIKKIINYGGACPFQVDALTDDNRRIYGRYRHGRVRIYISNFGDLTEYGAIDGDLIFSNLIGGPYDGCMSLDEFKEAAKSVLDWQNE